MYIHGRRVLLLLVGIVIWIVVISRYKVIKVSKEKMKDGNLLKHGLVTYFIRKMAMVG